MESKQLTFIDYQRKQTTTTPRTPPLASDGRRAEVAALTGKDISPGMKNSAR